MAQQIERLARFVAETTLDQVPPEVQRYAKLVALDKPAHEAMRRTMPGTKVLLAPGLPWGWLGEPPSVNRLIGLRWLASAFHPGEVKFDLRAEAREVHRLFYGVVPGDAEFTTLLEGATG